MPATSESALARKRERRKERKREKRAAIKRPVIVGRRIFSLVDLTKGLTKNQLRAIFAEAVKNTVAITIAE